MSQLGYAQSSDIKSRTWGEYRDDMKKKAISELECLDLLRSMLIERYGDEEVAVEKHGSDAILWFNPKARLSTAPDYRATWPDGTTRFYEFKQAIENDLPFFDFKKSNVGRGKKVHEDREFFYIARAENKVGFVAPKWVFEHATVGPVPAWGNREAYRVPRAVFLPQLQDGGDRLQHLVHDLEDKETLLGFQQGFLDAERERLSARMRRVVDEGEVFSIVPRTLNGFFEACFLMSHLSRFPDDAGLWLVYLLSFVEPGMTPAELARAMYAIDSLYFRAVDVSADGLRPNEHKAMVDGLLRVGEYLHSYPWDGHSIDPKCAPIDELRHMLFVVNRYEDWRQDVFYRWGEAPRPSFVRPARCIFDGIPDVPGVCARIRSVGDTSERPNPPAEAVAG